MVDSQSPTRKQWTMVDISAGLKGSSLSRRGVYYGAKTFWNVAVHRTLKITFLALSNFHPKGDLAQLLPLHLLPSLAPLPSPPLKINLAI